MSSKHEQSCGLESIQNNVVNLKEYVSGRARDAGGREAIVTKPDFEPTTVINLKNYIFEHARKATISKRLALKNGRKHDEARYEAQIDRLMDRLPYPNRHLQD